MNRTKNIQLIQENLTEGKLFFKIKNNKTYLDEYYVILNKGFSLKRIFCKDGNRCIYRLDSDGYELYYAK